MRVWAKSTSMFGTNVLLLTFGCKIAQKYETDMLNSEHATRLEKPNVHRPSWWYSMSLGKCQKLYAPYTNLKVFLVSMKHGIFS